LASKLGQSAAKRWRRLRGYQWLDKLDRGVTFIDGIEQPDSSTDSRSAACANSSYTPFANIFYAAA